MKARDYDGSGKTIVKLCEILPLRLKEIGIHTSELIVAILIVLILIGCGHRSPTEDNKGSARLAILDERQMDLPLYAWGPKLSTDGKRIVFAGRNPWDGSNSIWIVDENGSNLQPLTNAPNSYDPSWFPNEDKIIFECGGDLFTVDTTGQSIEQITANWFWESSPNVSPDGKTIVYASDSLDDKGDIWKMDLETSVATRLTSYEGIDGCPSWSADGRRIMYHCLVSGDDNIWVMDSSGNNKTQLTNSTESIATWTVVSPCETPDGFWIVYNIASAQQQGIWAIKPNGKNQFCLVTDGGNISFSISGLCVYDKRGKLFVAHYVSQSE